MRNETLRNTHLLVGLRLLIIGIAAFACLFALASCSSNSESSEAAEQPEATSTSTAMVLHNDGTEVLFVDQDTQTPYVPGLPIDNIFDAEGNVIEASDLEPGNIVTVKGNGIMLESYPAQYPGITSITLIGTGNPADVEEYAELIETVFPPADPNAMPIANLEYGNEYGQVTLLLNAFKCRMNENLTGETEVVNLNGSYVDGNGLIDSTTADAKITEATDAQVIFDRAFQNLLIDRSPIEGVSNGSFHMDLEAEQETVTYEIVEQGIANITIEPGYVYVVNATFANCEASFAFTVMN